MTVLVLAVLAGEALMTGTARGQGAGAVQGVGAAQSVGVGQGSGATAATADGSQFVLDASRRLMSVPLSAKVHHQINILDQTISGGDGGRYLQLGRGDRVRFELKLAIGNQREVASLVQVSNGEYLFVRRSLPGETVVTRLRLDAVYDALEAARQTAHSGHAIDWIAIGGIPRLLQVMQQNFDFTAPRSGRYGDRQVWVVEGRWKREALARLLPAQQSGILAGEPARLQELSPQVPTGVLLAFAADGEAPLFPLLLEYRRRTSEAEKPVALLTLRFDDVRRRPELTQEDFDYQITEQVPVVDVDPNAFIRSLGLEPVAP